MGFFSGFTNFFTQNPIVAALAGGTDVGNYFSGQQANKQAADNVAATNAANVSIADRNNALQNKIAADNVQLEKDFAQNGISWRVADAAKVGISPLAALGASEPSFSPVQPVFSSPQLSSAPVNPVPIGQGITAMMGQNLDRSLMVTKSPEERASYVLDLVNKSKQNDLLDAQVRLARINVAKASQSPGIPLAYTTVRNADGSYSNVANYNTRQSGFMGPVMFSLENQMLPFMMQDPVRDGPALNDQ